ncbi:MAG: diacylglycerol kinase family protein, partial [Cyanobacteria bacterium P01_F01_bin.42]
MPMDPESIIWRSPLVYRDSPASPNENPRASVGVLTANALTLRSEGKIVKSLPLETVIGIETLSTLTFRLHAYPVIQANYQYRPLTFDCKDAIACQKWIKAIREALGHTQTRSLTVLLNPSSGGRKGRKIFADIKPIFQQANCELSLYETQSADDLRQYVESIDLDRCSGIVVLGGDGSNFHTINGLMNHPDRDRAMKLPLGFIPAG